MQPLLDVARTFLQTAREEIEQGFEANIYVKVRDGAEKAWNAVAQATDHAMRVRGRTPLPGRDSHRDRREFLEEIGRSALPATSRTSPSGCTATSSTRVRL